MSETIYYSIIFALIAFSSYTGVEIFRRWSLRRGLFDVPNERSSHTTPTPRGGGLVIVVWSLLGYTIYSVYTGEKLAWGYLIGALLIALISWFDDLYSISFQWRFLIHTLAAILVIVSNGYFRELYIPLFHETLSLGTVGILLTPLWIVYLTNAYNFMDGIDGIAGMQCLTAGVGWSLIGFFYGFETIGFYGGVIAAAGFGFLAQNWQPAKIFMGDVGSAFLGFTFAVMPLLSGDESSASAELHKFLPLASLLLTWLFVFDTILTLLKRVFNREKIWEAHRGHLYQRLVIAGYSHQTVTILYGAISAVIVALTVYLFKGNFAGDSYLLTPIGWSSLGLMFLTRIAQKRRV